jgi:DNA-binding FadR family transcriptional regulator
VAVDIEPLQVPSLKEACVSRLAGLILSGQLRMGERLPPERELAKSLGVSRPVVHQAITDLEAKGLVEIVPRKGVFVNDFRTHGSCALLTTLLSYHEGALDERFFASLVDLRLLMETETARLAALNRSEEQLQHLQGFLVRETQTDLEDADAVAELDFGFHRLVALASDNVMYPLIINSFKPVYTNITRQFFAKHSGSQVLDQVFEYHQRLVAAIESRDGEAAAAIMAEMLQHGAEHL